MAASFPNSVKNYRAIANRPGVVYNASDTKTLFKEDIDGITQEIVAVETFLLAGGWRVLSVVPTLYEDQSPDYVLRFTSDITSLIAVGQRIKLSQHGYTKYFIVVAVGAFADGIVDIVVYGGTDYVIENTTTYPISNFSFSRFNSLTRFFKSTNAIYTTLKKSILHSPVLPLFNFTLQTTP